MINKKSIGFDFIGVNGLKAKEISLFIPKMSCGELLTCHVLAKKDIVRHLIRQELMRRLEVGDYVEITAGFERVKQKNGYVAYIEGRDYCKFGTDTIGFYRMEKGDDELTFNYLCKLQNVHWSATVKYPAKPWTMQTMRTFFVVMEGFERKFDMGC